MRNESSGIVVSSWVGAKVLDCLITGGTEVQTPNGWACPSLPCGNWQLSKACKQKPVCWEPSSRTFHPVVNKKWKSDGSHRSCWQIESKIFCWILSKIHKTIFSKNFRVYVMTWRHRSLVLVLEEKLYNWRKVELTGQELIWCRVGQQTRPWKWRQHASSICQRAPTVLYTIYTKYTPYIPNIFTKILYRSPSSLSSAQSIMDCLQNCLQIGTCMQKAQVRPLKCITKEKVVYIRMPTNSWSNYAIFSGWSKDILHCCCLWFIRCHVVLASYVLCMLTSSHPV